MGTDLNVDGYLTAENEAWFKKNVHMEAWASVAGELSVGQVIRTTDVMIESSQELKENISSISLEEATSLVEHLQPVSFSFKNDSLHRKLGFIAEQVPDIVASDDHKQVTYLGIISALTRVVKEQEKRIKRLEQVISDK